MTCYSIPLIALATHTGIRKKWPKIMGEKYHQWLQMMLIGAGLFGVIDHLWNGELLLIGPDIIKDLALGVTITLGVIITWSITIYLDKIINKKETTTKTTARSEKSE